MFMTVLSTRWPDGPLAPDDDPIDIDGHGTHCADIIGGRLGVAPGVSIYAVKVCSAISTSCSGIALLQGMEYSVDPNGDGDPSGTKARVLVVALARDMCSISCPSRPCRHN